MKYVAGLGLLTLLFATIQPPMFGYQWWALIVGSTVFGLVVDAFYQAVKR